MQHTYDFTNTGKQTNICFRCQKACGGCSWSEIDPATGKVRFEPVPGWTANPVLLKVSDRVIETYHITACPEFVPDEPRRSNNCELDDFQFAVLLRKWGIWG